MFLRLKILMSPYLIYGRRLILAALVVVLIMFVIMLTVQHPKTRKYNILEQIGLNNKYILNNKHISQSTEKILETTDKVHLGSKSTHVHKDINGDSFKTVSSNLTVNKNTLGLNNSNPLETKYQNTTIDNFKLISSNPDQNFSSNMVEDAIFFNPNPFDRTTLKEKVSKSTTAKALYTKNTLSKKYPTDWRNLVLTQEESPDLNNTTADRLNSTSNIEKGSTTVSSLTFPSSKIMMNVEPLKKDRLNLSLKTNANILENNIFFRSNQRTDYLNLSTPIAQNFTINKANASTKTEDVVLSDKNSPAGLNMSSKTELQKINLDKKEAPKLNNTNLNFTNPELSIKLPQNLTANKEKSRTNVEDILLASSKPPPGRTIFFLDSSFPPSESLEAHQACAVESAALHNPNLEIFVLFACPTHRNKSEPIIGALLNYKNVQFRELNLESYARDTPIADWLAKQGSRFRRFHMSELVRLLSLYRFGGIYLDTDVILLRSLEKEPLNYAGAETKTSIGNAVLSLEPHGLGHQVAELLLRDFRENCGKRAWVQHGPMGLARILSTVCGTKNVTLMVNDRHRCRGFKVFNVSAFYEVPWEQAHLFFDPRHANETLQRTRDSLLVHMWRHMIPKWPLKIDSKAAYWQLAAQHCPRVFAAHFT